MKPQNLLTAIALIAVIGFSTAGCDNGANPGGGGSGGGGNAPAVTEVTVNPATATVAKGRTQQFNATVTGTNNPAQTVTWTVTGGGNGTSINPSGLLTVAANETAETLTIRAVSTVDAKQSGTATVAVIAAVFWTVHDLATWGEAVNGIRSGGDNKTHIITVSGDISVLVTPASENTFGSVTGITINIEGSGAISLSAGGSGRMLQIGDGQTVIVKNLTLQGRNSNDTSLVRINSGGTFRMEGSASVTGNTTSYDGGGVYVYGGTFTMRESASVTGNTASYDGGGVYIYGGTFTMQENASVTGNTVSSYGGGVYIYGGTFTMRENASVTGNTAKSLVGNIVGGGGVYVDGSSVTFIGNGTFIMEGNAMVNDNTANDSRDNGETYGGGVFVDSNGTFTMRQGSISGNTANGTHVAEGGGVFININGTFTMEDGMISNNTVSAVRNGNVEAGGGGVCGGTFTMKGGTISGNTVSGAGRTSSTVYASGGGVCRGTFTMQGGTISGNTVSASNTASSGKTEVCGGGVFVNTNNSFTKTSGTIYGNDAADDLSNTVIGGKGHAVYGYWEDNWRNATAGPAMNTGTYGFWLNEIETQE
jgi:hypothetical protein